MGRPARAFWGARSGIGRAPRALARSAPADQGTRCARFIGAGVRITRVLCALALGPLVLGGRLYITIRYANLGRGDHRTALAAPVRPQRVLPPTTTSIMLLAPVQALAVPSAPGNRRLAQGWAERDSSRRCDPPHSRPGARGSIFAPARTSRSALENARLGQTTESMMEKPEA
ncbi:MAG: hypothetical protein JWM95_670 [Gemmatimonadetes bacterium]|nr:hypothetical protein [Gemmatimonadota bacterium]